MSNKENQMWGGRFNGSPEEIMVEINQSISIDQALYKEDIQASIAHTNMLSKQSIIQQEEAEKIIMGLTQILAEIEEGKFIFKKELEDIHMNIESRLHEIIGDIAGKMHTARSRNDQVVTDFKIFTRKAFVELQQLLSNLTISLIDKANQNIHTYAPGFTHMQTAQPISLAHHFLAYVEMFIRDLDRIKCATERMNESPLGACALAGTSFDTDRFMTAEMLGFKSPTRNSIDSVSDRDFVLDYLATASIIITHMSRLCEELVLWMSKGFDFIQISDKFTTGSSIMPQKRNPDAAELIRAKTGRIIGNFTNILITLKALPLTYSKDMQEDKLPLFETVDILRSSISVLTAMIQDMKINQNNLLNQASLGYANATEIADWLVRNLKKPFRQAHHITGNIVKLAEEDNKKLEDLSLAALQKICPEITEDIFNYLSIENAVNCKKSYGGTSPEQISQQLIYYKQLFNL